MIERLTEKFNAGELIFAEQDLGDFAYVIDQGEVEIFIQVDGNDHVLNTLLPSQMFGELALIDNSPRSASARAKTNVVVNKISNEQLQTIIQNADPIVGILLTSVTGYFRSESERIKIHQYCETLEHQIKIRQESMEEAFAEIHSRWLFRWNWLFSLHFNDSGNNRMRKLIKKRLDCSNLLVLILKIK